MASNSQVRVFNLFSFISLIVGIFALIIGGVAIASIGAAPNISRVEGVGFASTPVDGQVLMYDADLGCWTNGDIVIPDSAVFGVANLTDSRVASPVDGQVLVYNASLGKWVNGDLSVVPHVEAGVSAAAFSLNSTGFVAQNFTFTKPFASVPTVVVGVVQIAGENATVVNVESLYVTPSGFIAQCYVSNASVNGSARFSFVAVD